MDADRPDGHTRTVPGDDLEAERVGPALGDNLAAESEIGSRAEDCCGERPANTEVSDALFVERAARVLASDSRESSTITHRPDHATSDLDLTLTYVIVRRDGEGSQWPHHHDESAELAFGAGRVLQGRYVLTRELGRGGMGQVYLGKDTRLDRPVAVKVILPFDRGRRGEGESLDARERARFAAEARLGANLTHPAIATVFDYGIHEGRPFTVFEYIPGETLRELMRRRRWLPVDEVRHLVGILAQALDFAHSRHIVHADLKPENIRTTEQGQLKILDLGLAREFLLEADWSGFAGTPAYCSPEQAAGLACDGRSDQYSLALITYELLTGRRPFESDDWRALLEMHKHAELVSPRAVQPDLPKEVCDALERALLKDPHQRHATCGAFAAAIGCQFLSNSSAGVEPVLEGCCTAMVFRREYMRFPLRKPSLALSRDILAAAGSGRILRVPLGAIEDVSSQRRNTEIRILLRPEPGQSPIQVFLRFREREECRKWLDRVSEQRAAGLAKAETYAELDWRLVSMLDRSPEGQYQIVGPVEARSTRSYDARARAQIRAMLAGGHAITDIKEERLDDHDRTERRVSGIAIRAIDQRGRLNLLARGFALNVAVMTGWMLRVIKWFGALALFPGAALFAASRFSAWSSLVARLDPVLAAELPRTELQALSRYVLTVLAALAWPLGVVLFLRRLRWPQLVGPAAVAVGALGTGPVLVLVGLGLGFSGIAARWGFPPWTVILMISLVSVTAVLGVVTGRGLRVVYVNNRSLARSLLEVDATRRVGPKRRAVGMTAWIVSVLYSGALAVSLTMWGAGILSGRGESFFYSMWRQAYDSLMLARAHAVDNPKAAEEDFERALSLWDALGKVCPHTPACTPAIQQSHAITYHDLASFQKRTRRLKEAEESLREAVKLDEELVRDFPGRAELRGQLQFHRDALSRLERLKEIRGRSGPIRDGLRQQPTGRAIRSKRVDAGPAAH